MKKGFALIFLFSLIHFSVSCAQWIRVNQQGYLPGDSKIAVWLTNQPENIKDFKIIDHSTKKVVFSSKMLVLKGAQGALRIRTA